MRRPSRAARRSLTAPGNAAWAAILALNGGRAIIDVDDPTLVVEDPGNPGFVLRFIDKNDPTHWFVQADTTKQVPMPAAHADFGGRKCVTVASGQFYDSNRAAASWKLHDGTGWSVHAVATLTSAGSRRLFATTAGGFLGIALHYAAGPLGGWFIGNASATVVFRQVAAVLNTPHQISGQYQNGAALPNESSFKITGQAEANENDVATPSSSNAATMRLFAEGGAGSTFFVGRFALGVFGPAYSAANRTAMRSALQQLTTVAA